MTVLASVPNRSRRGGWFFVIPGRVQHAIGLKVAFEAREHEWPAFANRIKYPAAFREVVVRYGELDLVLLLFEIDHDARGLLCPVKRFVHRVERVGQPPWRIVFEHFALYDQLALDEIRPARPPSSYR